MNAIILAGKNIYSKAQIEKEKKKLKREYNGEEYPLGLDKALFKINKKPIVQYVVDAFRSSKSIDVVFVVGNKLKLEKELKSCTVIESSGSIVDNALNGYKKSKSKGLVFFSTCDIPLVKSRYIDEFVQDCSNYDAGIYFSVTEKKYLKGQRMHNRRYISVKEGDYLLSYYCIVNPDKINLDKLLRVFNIIYENRKMKSIKSWFVLIKKLRKEVSYRSTVPILLKYMISPFIKSLKISLKEVEDLVEKELGMKIKIIDTEHYENSIDVDSYQDLEYVKNLMKKN
jgi:CMP-2-keto-3-deoxyoctulosonic acid synthetase